MPYYMNQEQGMNPQMYPGYPMMYYMPPQNQVNYSY